MWLIDICKRCGAMIGSKRRGTSRSARQNGVSLRLEELEDRSLPSSYTASSLSQLIADIKAANLHGGTNAITLTTGKTFKMTAVNNTTDGANGLPVIAAGNNLTIMGNGDTIARDAGANVAAFRLFDVAPGAALTLDHLTLQGGLAFGVGVSAEGGAILNQGSLTLTAVTVTGNTAQGASPTLGSGAAAAGGGIFSSGTLVLQNRTSIQNNLARGGDGANGRYVNMSPFAAIKYIFPGHGGAAFGGGMYVAGGTVIIANATLSANTAQGGLGGRGGTVVSGGAGGGGFYAAAGTVAITDTAVTVNSAIGGGSASGKGGGLYIDLAAQLSVEAFSLAHILNNNASTSDPDIFGPYTIA